MDGTRETHESYGLLQISRTSCQPAQVVFGSSIKTGNPIRLRVHRAEKHRDLHREWYHDKETIVEIEMSPAQFAEAITTLNVGVGVPCTIRYVDSKRMDKCPDEGVNELFNDEFKEDIRDVAATLTELQTEAKRILGAPGTVKKADKTALLSRIYHAEQMVRSNMPFVHEQFTRAMDKTVQQGKAEIEAFMDNAVRRVGLENMKDVPDLIGEKEEP